jgi:outer membrane receptor protein involved in Fe transport
MNTTNFVTKKTSLSLALATIFSSPLFAQEKLDDITVVGENREKSVERLNLEDGFYKPYSKDVVGKQTILDENIPDITEAIRDIPGVTITESGAFSKQIRIRGLQGARVVTLVDGIKIANQGMNHSGSGEINMTDISTVEKIEVVKGSPSVVYDPGASGGVVNVVTSQAAFKKGMGFKHQLSYDEGYNKRSSSTQLEASTGDIGARVIYTREDARDYKISGEKDKEIAIARTNSLNNTSPTAIPVKDLGYESESISTRVSAKVGEDGIVDVNLDRWIGKDMASIHGVSISDATVLQYDRMDRDFMSAGYRKSKLGFIDNFNIKVANQTLFQAIGKNARGTNLESRSVNFFGDIFIDKLDLKVGGEFVFDNAETLVKSEQDYYAAFASAEYKMGDFTVFAGGRYNHWDTRQIPYKGTNIVVAEDLIGISGITPEKQNASPTWSLGLQYEITPTQNVSANVNTTFRNPNLYERYAFGGFIGGGLAMKPEEGQHAEISWKYLDDNLAITASAFYSNFENYIWSKTIDQLYNRSGLEACIRADLCDPATGDFNDRKGDFYNSYNKYYNSDEVTNWGSELSLLYNKANHEIGGNVSFNEIKSDDIFVYSGSQPLNFNIHYKYDFGTSWKPWVKAKLQSVFDIPEVRQYQGFDPYTVANIYAGFKKNGFIVSAGVRNITNETYHVAYNGINALERSFFTNFSYEFSTH